MKRAFSVLLILVLTFSIVGCTKNNPEDTVESFLNDVKNGNIENLSEYLKEDDDYEVDADDFMLKDELEQAMIKAYSKLEYETLNTEVDGNKATAETKIKAPNLGEAMSSTISELLPGAFMDALEEAFDENPEKEFDEEAFQKKMEETFIKKISKDDISMVENTVKVKMIKKDDKWLIDSDDEFFNALSGNLKKVFDSFDDFDDME